jgi:hypothetical protein
MLLLPRIPRRLTTSKGCLLLSRVVRFDSLRRGTGQQFGRAEIVPHTCRCRDGPRIGRGARQVLQNVSTP